MQSEKNIVTRLNFAKALVKKGYAKTVKEALDKYLHKGIDLGLGGSDMLIPEIF